MPFGILLGWYAVINGSLVVAGRVAERLELCQGSKIRTLPPLAALVGIGLDLVLDPAGLDAGLWEWNADGVYAAKIKGVNGNSGVPLVNYLGWAVLVGGVVYAYGLAYEYEDEEELLPAVLLLPLYLAAVGWALRRRRFGPLLYSVPFPVALYAALEKR